MVVDRKRLFMLLGALPASFLLTWRRYIKRAIAILASVAVLLSAEKSTYSDSQTPVAIKTSLPGCIVSRLKAGVKAPKIANRLVCQVVNAPNGAPTTPTSSN